MLFVWFATAIWWLVLFSGGAAVAIAFLWLAGVAAVKVVEHLGYWKDFIRWIMHERNKRRK